MNVNPPAALPPRWQFGLRELMVVMLVLSVYFAAIVWLGPCMGYSGGSAIAIYVVTYILCRVHALTLVELGVLIALIGTFVALLMPAVQVAKITPPRTLCGLNLRQIGMAMQLYHDVYNTFPPAYVADATGKPMHSWRVLILTQLGRPDLFAQYRFDEPWDGQNNRLLHSAIVQTYRCQNDVSGVAERTNYVVVIGPGTVFPDDKSTSMSQITDGTSYTLFVVEVHNSGIHWMEPRDLHVTQMATTINPKAGPGVSSMHPGGAMAVFVDGHVQLITNDIPTDQLRARLTIAGGEKIIDD